MMDLVTFRAQFPALDRVVYLNTATAPPGARPVLAVLRAAMADWEAGRFSWQAWEREAHATRGLFAELIGVDRAHVALASSVAEAAATVAASIHSGRVVVGEREFNSNLLPWLALRTRGIDVATVPDVDGILRGDHLAAAIDEDTVLVAVSEVQSSTGVRVDLEPIAERARAVGARLFVNLTQSLGALRFHVADVDPDFVVAHGYKWLLGVRGSAWMYVRPDRFEELRPLLPNWHSFEDPYADYYGAPDLARDARRLDTSYSWLPWVGSRAALDLLRSLDPAEVEERCLSLSASFRRGAHELGLRTVAEERPTQIVTVEVPDASATKRRLAEAQVVAAVRDGRVRFGFHGFSDDRDVAAALGALKDGTTG